MKHAVNEVQSHAQLNRQLARSPEELAAWEAIDRDQLWPGDPGFSAAASAAGAHLLLPADSCASSGHMCPSLIVCPCQTP